MTVKKTALRTEGLRTDPTSRSRRAFAIDMRLIQRMLLLILLVPLAACFEEETVAVSYSANNHTDKGIVSIIINGEGGVLGAPPQGQGGGVCCVVLPRKWRPGLRAKIEWLYDSTSLLDAHGKEVIKDGQPVLIAPPWNEKTIEVPQYDDRMGYFQLHIYPNGEVKSVVSNLLPHHPDYPEPK